MTSTEQSGQDRAGAVLVVFAGGGPPPPWSDLLGSARELGVSLLTARVGGPGRAPAREPWQHVLSAGWTGSRWRRPFLTMASASVDGRRRAVLAARFDPWFRDAVRRSRVLVVLGAAADEIGGLARGFNPRIEVQEGEDSLRQVLRGKVGERLTTLLDDVEGGDPAGRDDALARLLDTLRPLSPPVVEAVVPDEAVGRLRALAASSRADGGLPLVGALSRLGVLPPAVADAYAARDDLDRTGRTAADPGGLAARVLDDVAALGDTDAAAAVEWTGLALEVAFHRELHSDSVDSPLLTAPDAYLEPLRATTVWRTLTAAAGPPPRTPAPPAGPDPTDTVPWRPDRPHQVRVTMLPGPYGTFQAPVEEALRQVAAAHVHAVPRQELPAHLRGMGVTRGVVGQRMTVAGGGTVRGYARLAREIEDADVVVIDWADKAAVLATLLAPEGTRIVLRVHGVDVLRPWIHLLDWSRIEALVCVSAPLLQAVQDVVGERARAVPASVVPNLVDLERFARVADRERDPRTLCLVGWAQRVKDPVWALEVLSRLREDGQDWRLLLVGADLSDDASASGAEHAERFRRRAMADDVRDHVEYTGYVHDLPPVLARAGVVLSTSLRESWPVGFAEGVAAGALPVARQWPMTAARGGARAVWPDTWVVDDVDGAVARIRAHQDPVTRTEEAARARAELGRLADPRSVAGILREVVLGTVGRLAHLTLAGEHAEAARLASEVLRDDGATEPQLHQASVSAGLAGEPSLRLEILRRWAARAPHPYVGYQLRRQQGLLQELAPGWRPALTIGPRTGVAAPDRPRVLHLLKVSLPYRQSGYAVRSFYLLREQARAGTVDVVAATGLDFPPPREHPDAPAEETVGGVRHVRLIRPEVPEREFADDHLQAYATALEELVRRERPTILHVHSGHRGYELALVALAVGEAVGIPVVYEVRGFFEAVWTSAVHRAESAEIYRLRRAVEADCMHRAGAVVTLSEAMRDDILGRTRPDADGRPVPAVDPDRVFVVPNGVDVDRVVPRPRRSELVRRLGLEDTFVFGYVSNLDHPREGHELLVDAVRELRTAGRPATALIVGDGARREELQARAERAGVAEHVVFTGQVPHDEVADYYALLDVFVVPRVDERAARLVTPLKPYEAMAMGLPLVVSDLPALVEIVGRDERGLTFPTGDSAGLRRVLEVLADDPALRAGLGARGRAWVQEHRTWSSIAAGYDSVYAVLPAATRSS